MAARRFSQAISEGDGISVLVEVHGLDDARAATADGAEAIVVRSAIEALRGSTELPVLWRAEGLGAPADAARAGADACLVVVEHFGEDGDGLDATYRAALDLGLDCVVEVHDEEELELALERLDPEIFLLGVSRDADMDSLQGALDLLPDVPAGKLAVADVPVVTRDEVVQLERAGVDAVIVGVGNVAELVGEAPPEV